MSEPLLRALTRLRAMILDDEALVRAVASGRRRGTQPPWRRVELRYVDLKAGRHLQVTAYDDAQAHTANHAVGDPARAALDGLLEQPFGNWHVDTTTGTHQLRVSKKGEAVVHSRPREDESEVDRDHDRDKGRLLPEDDPVFRALGLSDHEGRMKPSRQGKYRQVEEFLRILDASITDALDKGHLRTPTPREPLEQPKPPAPLKPPKQPKPPKPPPAGRQATGRASTPSPCGPRSCGNRAAPRRARRAPECVARAGPS